MTQNNYKVTENISSCYLDIIRSKDKIFACQTHISIYTIDMSYLKTPAYLNILQIICKYT